MVANQAVKIILPFRHEAPTCVGTLADLRNLLVGRESIDSGSRPFVVYGVPNAGKTTLVSQLRDKGLVVLDTDDVVDYVLGRQVHSYVKKLKDRMYHEPARLSQEVVDYVLTHPGGEDPFYPWRAGKDAFSSVDACKAAAMDKVCTLLCAEETYSDWTFTHSEGVAQIVVTNLTTIDWYDAGFFRTPDQAVIHSQLMGKRTRHWFTDDGEVNVPIIGPSPETLMQWYARSFGVVRRVNEAVILEEDEWIVTA